MIDYLTRQNWDGNDPVEEAVAKACDKWDAEENEGVSSVYIPPKWYVDLRAWS